MLQLLKILYSIFSYPWFPSWEEAAKIFGVHGLLYEEVHLAGHAEHCTFFHSFKFLLKSYQDTLCHFVEQLVFITEKETRVLGSIQILITTKIQNNQICPYFDFLLHP